MIGMVTGRFNNTYMECMDMFMAQIERDAGNIVFQTCLPLVNERLTITITITNKIILKNSLFRCFAVLETLKNVA